MTYFDVALLQQDQDFRNRVAAAYSLEVVAAGGVPVGLKDPWAWASTYAWPMASTPGFADAYAYAIAMNNPSPGKDPAVITDGMILSAVQLLLAPPTEEVQTEDQPLS